MKYCVIYGSPRKKNTYDAVQIVKKRLNELEPSEFKEFFLAKDLPEFCLGCFRCFSISEEKCPHRRHIEPIESAMREADGLILATPVYVMEMTGTMKNFLDHFGFRFMAHRPMAEMFQKSAAVIATTAGAGTKYALDGVCRSLSFWGISRIYRCGITMFAGSFDELKPPKREKMERALARTAEKLYGGLKKQPKASLKTKGMFYVMRHAVFHLAENPVDQSYWTKLGWGHSERPWKQIKGKIKE